ncbi:MAG: hypothetical protein K6T66_13100 [Peptococcaceae bacterium]|nr:hypothetical protein [Peptococcaceae bacterium]
MLIDLKEYIGDLQAVKSFPLFFERYEIEEHEGKEYLTGHGFVKCDIPAIYNSPAILFAFINLVQPPLPQSFKSDNPAPMKKAVPDKRIKKFCKKFGMPYIEGRGNAFYPALEDMLQDNMHIHEAKLELRHFRFRVAWLYTHFQIWYALYSGEDKEKVIPGFIAGWEQAGKTKEEAAKDKLGKEVTMRMGNLPIAIEYTHNKYVLGFRARYLIDIAYFHLANLMTMEKSDVRQHLKTCNNPRCRQFFWAQHGRQKYCVFCDRRVVFIQQKRGSN